MKLKDDILKKLLQSKEDTCSISWSNKVIFVIGYLILITGCLTKKYDYGCGVWLVNSTDDTLYALIGRTSINTEITSNQFTVLPHDTIDGSESLLGGLEINEGMNPAEYFLSGHKPLLDTVLVEKQGILKAAWYFPAKSAPESEHSFFNYNSWNLVKFDKHYAAIIFTIYESDLILNN